MIEQEKGLLYLIKLNNTSFEQNPGRINLPKGHYVAEIREGSFSYKFGYSSDVEVLYRSKDGKKKIKFPNFGKFKTKENAENIYQGISVEFQHEGGEIEVYNPKPANQYFNKIVGECIVGIWDGRTFGSPFGCFEPQGYNPTSNNNILILRNGTSRPYQTMMEDNWNVTWQSDLSDFGKFNAIIVPPESYSFIYKIRDKDCLDSYIKSGGRVYLVGAALQYLSYYNSIPFKAPWYLDNNEYNVIATSAGDMLGSNFNEYIRFNTSLTIPALMGDGMVYLYSSDINIGNKWCAMKRIKHDKGKIVWSSFFLMDYDNTENWNNLVLDQISWLLE